MFHSSIGTSSWGMYFGVNESYQIEEMVLLSAIVTTYLFFIFQVCRLVVSLGESHTRVTIIERSRNSELKEEDSEEEEPENSEEGEDLEEDSEEDPESCSPPNEEEYDLEVGDEPDEEEEEEKEGEEEGKKEDGDKKEGEDEVQATHEEGWKVMEEPVRKRKRPSRPAPSANEGSEIVDVFAELWKNNGIAISGESERFFRFMSNVVQKCNDESVRKRTRSSNEACNAQNSDV